MVYGISKKIKMEKILHGRNHYKVVLEEELINNGAFMHNITDKENN